MAPEIRLKPSAIMKSTKNKIICAASRPTNACADRVFTA